MNSIINKILEDDKTKPELPIDPAHYDVQEAALGVLPMVLPDPEQRTELVAHESYDEKDNEVELQLDDVYAAAKVAYEHQIVAAEAEETRFRPRNREVAAQYLNIALEALKQKQKLKEHKDTVVLKMNKPDKYHGGININKAQIVVADRNDILAQYEDEPIELDAN